MIPESLLSVASSRNDGITCDFCGQVMSHVQPQQLPDTFQGRRGCKGGDLVKTRQWQTDDLEWEACDSSSVEQRKKKNYVYCGECGKGTNSIPYICVAVQHSLKILNLK